MSRDDRVPFRIFGGMAAFIVVMAGIYWLASYEDIGTTMLIATAGLASMIGVWLYLQERRGQTSVGASPDASPDGAAPAEAEAQYLPGSSPWPLAMAGGAALSLNGLVLSWPYAVPGLAFLGASIIGFVAQGRRRA